MKLFARNNRKLGSVCLGSVIEMSSTQKLWYKTSFLEATIQTQPKTLRPANHTCFRMPSQVRHDPLLIGGGRIPCMRMLAKRLIVRDSDEQRSCVPFSRRCCNSSVYSRARVIGGISFLWIAHCQPSNSEEGGASLRFGIKPSPWPLLAAFSYPCLGLISLKKTDENSWDR